MTDNVNEEHIWKIIEQYKKQKTGVDHQLDSFNHFINTGIQSVIEKESDIEVKTPTQDYKIHFGNVFVPYPSIIEEDRTLKLIYPHEARIRDLNYDSSICCDITETISKEGKVIEQNVYRRKPIGRIPIMLRSCRCNLTKLTDTGRIEKNECYKDEGGYFIIKGNERVLVAQLIGNYNKVIVLKPKPGDKKFSHIAEIRSMSEETGHSILVKALMSVNNRSVYFSLPYIKENIPAGIVFKALGFIEEDDIANLIGTESKEFKTYVNYILRDSFFIKTQEEALNYIGQNSIHIVPKDKRGAYAWQVVETELFPHLGISATIKEKAIFLGNMLKKLLSTRLGIRLVDDRDDYKNKRVETAGMLCYNLFRTLFKRYKNNIQMQIEKKKSRIDIVTIVNRLSSITSGLKYSFATGNWGVQKNSYIRTGVSQVLCRLSYGATKSHLRRIIIPVGKEGKNAKIRQIHSSQFGYICPVETPEGQSAGIVLNMSFLTRVTKGTPVHLVKELLEDIKYISSIDDVKLGDLQDKSPVFLNGILIGLTEEPDELVEEIQNMKRQHRLSIDDSVVFNEVDNQVSIYCDSGRFSRPLFTIKNGKLRIKKTHGLKWDKLVRKDLIRYVDCSEIEQAVVAMTPKTIPTSTYDYCEIHPSMMMGVMGNIIPFPDHSQAPRNCYQCLDLEELVVMGDYTKRKIKDIKVNDVVISVNPKTLEQVKSKVVNHFVKETDKTINELTTVSGRKITATFDHKMLTTNGWLDIKDIGKDTKVCIVPQQKYYSHISDGEIILENIEDMKKVEMKHSVIRKHDVELRRKKLLPLRSNNDNLPIIARMIGFLLTDGSCGVYRGCPQVQMTFGSKKGCLKFQEDVRTLGYTNNKTIYVESKLYGNSTQVIYNNSFATLLISLADHMVGKRTNKNSNKIPSWIMKGSMSVKREFLSGFQGGNGCQIRYNKLKGRNSGNFILNSTSMTKRKEYTESLVNMFEQVKSLFSQFDIACTGPKVRQSRKDLKSNIVHLYFSNTI